METGRYSQKIREENEMRTQRFHSQLRWCLGIVMSASLCGWASIGPITYLTSLSENGSGVATNAIRRETNSKYKMPVDLSPTFMPLCGDLSQIAELDPTYNSRAFFSNCEIYPLENPTGKELTVLFVDRKGLNRNIDNNGKFIIGTAEVQVEGGIIDMFNKTNVRIVDMRWVQIERFTEIKHNFIIGNDVIAVGVNGFGEIGVSQARALDGNNSYQGPFVFQINKNPTASDTLTLGEWVKPISKSAWLYIAGLVLAIRQLYIFLGHGAQRIIKVKGSDGVEVKVKEKAFYGPKAAVALLFGGGKYSHIVKSTATGSAETVEVANDLASVWGLGKALRALILGR